MNLLKFQALKIKSQEPDIFTGKVAAFPDAKNIWRVQPRLRTAATYKEATRMVVPMVLLERLEA